MEDIFEELRQQNKHLMEMLRHMHEENLTKMNRILELVGAEEHEIQEELSLQEKWFKQLAFQAAKIYGEEHQLTKHYKEAYALETGKTWDD